MSYLYTSECRAMKEVKKFEEAPKGPHFCVLIYTTESRYTPGYDDRDSGTSYTEHIVKQYVTENKATLESFVKTLYHTGEKQFVFFHVPSVGTYEVKVNVQVST